MPNNELSLFFCDDDEDLYQFDYHCVQNHIQSL